MAKALELDKICADAVGLAREAAMARAGVFVVGEHLGVVAEDKRVVTHFFAVAPQTPPL